MTNVNLVRGVGEYGLTVTQVPLPPLTNAEERGWDGSEASSRLQSLLAGEAHVVEKTQAEKEEEKLERRQAISDGKQAAAEEKKEKAAGCTCQCEDKDPPVDYEPKGS